MNIFIAGGTGAIGRVLMPLLVNAGHKVVALTRSAYRASQLEQMGALPVVGDVFDEVRLARLVADSEAEVVIHQLTAFGTKEGDPYAETIDGVTENISCSIGISIFPDHAEDAEGLIERADRAMYAAKAASKKRYVFFSPS